MELFVWTCRESRQHSGACSFFLQLAEEFYSSASEHDRLVQRAARSLNKLYEIIYSAGIFLTAEEQQELRRCLVRFGTAFQQLREIASREERMQWHISPKVHISQHLAGQAAVMNPRYCQNYTEESGIGTTAAVWHRSAVGRYRASAQRLVLIKRAVALFIRFEGILPADE